ncbi:MAG: riboflavin synthase [Bacteroidia bacterium]
MFSGIIETMGKLQQVESHGENLRFLINCVLVPELKVDQSIAHNGVCLTVEAVHSDVYQVTAVAETLRKTNLHLLQPGHLINLERSVTLQTRLDGHLVQGHADTTARCTALTEAGGSWEFTFAHEPGPTHLIVEKGSVTVNGISLTAFNVSPGQFSVAIIPYTFEHTNLHLLKPKDLVNIEFDLIGKYVATVLQRQR